MQGLNMIMVTLEETQTAPYMYRNTLKSTSLSPSKVINPGFKYNNSRFGEDPAASLKKRTAINQFVYLQGDKSRV